MDNYIKEFAKRYIRKPSTDEIPDEISYNKVCELIRIYNMAMNGVDNVNLENIRKEFSEMGYISRNGKLIVKIKPRRKESKLAGKARGYMENMGIILLHEVPCRSNNKLDYDYAFIYKGILGNYLYYVEIDGSQHFTQQHYFNNPNGKEHDIIKTTAALKYGYLIRIDYNNVDKTEKILRKAFKKLTWESSLTTTDSSKYKYLQSTRPDGADGGKPVGCSIM